MFNLYLTIIVFFSFMWLAKYRYGTKKENNRDHNHTLISNSRLNPPTLRITHILVHTSETALCSVLHRGRYNYASLPIPCQHRVHDINNREYLDKNHNCLFFIFDKLFNASTNEPLFDSPQYGTNHAVSCCTLPYLNLFALKRLDNFFIRSEIPMSKHYTILIGLSDYKLSNPQPLNKPFLLPGYSVTLDRHCIIVFLLGLAGSVPMSMILLEISTQLVFIYQSFFLTLGIGVITVLSAQLKTEKSVAHFRTLALSSQIYLSNFSAFYDYVLMPRDLIFKNRQYKYSNA